jgi:hypothetical protein
MDKQNRQPDTIDTMQTDSGTYEIRSFFGGDLPLMELLKNALKRDAQAVLRQMDNPET